MERRRLSVYEQEFIIKNSKSICVPDLAKRLGREVGTIRSYIKRHHLKTISAKGHRNVKVGGIEFTPQQFKVLKLIACGLSNSKISDLLFIEKGAVVNHKNTIRKKIFPGYPFENINERVMITLWFLKNTKKIKLESIIEKACQAEYEGEC